jgi:hypothetical protein
LKGTEGSLQSRRRALQLHRRAFLALAGAVPALGTLLPATARTAGEQAVAGGWFYPQAGPGNGTGYMVANVGAQGFYDAFTGAGSINSLGYPISRRYDHNGFIRQAFQRAVLQWDPNSDAISFANLIDEVGDSGGSVGGVPMAEWLLSVWQIPATADWLSDVGRPWEEVVDANLALLDQNAAIAARFYAISNWLDLYGLPTAYADFGPVRTLRAQRAVFQHWTDAGP